MLRLAGPRGLGHEIAPGRETTAELALWKLEQEHGQGLAYRLEVGERDELVRIADELPVEPVQPGVPVLLVQLQMARRMKCDGAAASPVAPDAHGDLLGHRPTRDEDRRLLAEKLCDPALEARYPLAGSVRLAPLVRRRVVGDRLEKLRRRRRAVPGVQEALRPADRRVDAFASGRHASTPAALRIEPLRRRPHRARAWRLSSSVGGKLQAGLPRAR